MTSRYLLSGDEQKVRARPWRRALPVAVFGALAVAGCYDQPTGPATETDGRLIVSGDEDALAARMHYVDEDVPVDPPSPEAFAAEYLRGLGLEGGARSGDGIALAGGSPVTSGPMRVPSDISLTLIAEVDAPDLDGVTLQATSISRRSRNALLVSYNVRGDTFLGGVDYIINWFGRFPRILSTAGFADSDASSVALSGSDIYVAQATDASGFSTSAALERLSLGFWGISLDNERVDLSSFAATSVTAIGSEVWVTTGDDGDVYALDADDLGTEVGRYALDDARWVEYDADGGRVVVAQGTPGRLAVFREGSFPGGSLELLNTFPFPGADVPESKSAFDIAGDKAFIAAGPEGVQIVCLDNGQIVGNVPRPDPAALGLDPSVVVTNAVTVDDDLMFISNGEAGVYVAAGTDDWEDTACDAPQTITVFGRLQFDALESVNHVDYRSGFLFVAAGLGGVKVVSVDVTP